MPSNYSMAASITAAAAVLSDWTANMAEDPRLEECGRHRFLIAGSFDSPFGFWQWLALPFGGDPAFVNGVSGVDLNGGRAFMSACEHGMCIWAKWPDEETGLDDLEIVDVADGIAVMWTPRAEEELCVADALATYVVREGLELRPYEEPEED